MKLLYLSTILSLAAAPAFAEVFIPHHETVQATTTSVERHDVESTDLIEPAAGPGTVTKVTQVKRTTTTTQNVTTDGTPFTHEPYTGRTQSTEATPDEPRSI